MDSGNGAYDHATIAQAIAALLLGDLVRVRFGDQAERRRLGHTFRRYAVGLGYKAEVRTQEPFLLVRWTKAASDPS